MTLRQPFQAFRETLQDIGTAVKASHEYTRSVEERRTASERRDNPASAGIPL